MKSKLFFLIILLFFSNATLAHSQRAVNTAPALNNTISLDIKGMDIIDVLKMISSCSGMNIIVGKNVAGRVTIFLKDVNVLDAFEIILLANDLAYEKKGEVVSVMTQKDYESAHGIRFEETRQIKVVQLKYARAESLLSALGQIKSDTGKVIAEKDTNSLILVDAAEKLKDMENIIKNTDLPIQTRIFSVKYATVDKLSSKIEAVITKGVGSINIDERTNNIVVTDYPHKLDDIAKIISAFDEKTPQVLIDAQIIELKPSDKFEMGIDYDYWINKYFEVRTSLPINTDNALLIGTTSASPAEKGQPKAVLDILHTIGDTKILSSPRIMVLNNQEAKILVGTKDAYITSTTSIGSGTATVTSQSVNFVDTGIKLYVTPTINADGFVIMKIRPEVSSAKMTDIKSEDKVTQIPIVTTSELESSIMVKDGITIVMGGLRKDSRDKTVKKIPFLGDIPGLGYLFRSTSDEVAKTELVILLTPHIISGEKAFVDFSEIKPKEGAVVRMEKGNILTEKIRAKTSAPTANIEGEYYRLITEKVRALIAFKNLPKDKKGNIDISFKVNSDGKVLEEPVVLSSLSPELNRQIIRDMQGSLFPPFPADMGKTEKSFHIVLEF